ncbi:hypothetical protein DHEL01_v212604 [Diaporthe helianthi]|uniref:Uncharacterized protein n=1 Tax=Diaporthe helianthi TaxID=158607 RepID=A0A2P5HFI9_DIAHE|nr:hypothetical protein DHEL01_v212604 [Diaporthe helianthi]
MPVKPPPRWTARSLTYMFLPEYFRKPKNFAEAIGPIAEKVPLDADMNHRYIKRRVKNLTKQVCDDYKLNHNVPEAVGKRHAWNAATGEWVPIRSLRLDHFFPFALGPKIAPVVSPRIQFQSTSNAFLLPPEVWDAYNNWKMAIVPQKEWRRSKIPQDYMFRILESSFETLMPVYRGSTLMVGDLDRRPLWLRPASRLKPNAHACYFQSCCAVWKLTYLEQPDRSPEEFWERFQYKMDDLWGTLAQRNRVLSIFKPVELLKPVEIEERAANADEVITSVRDESAMDDTPEGQSVQLDTTSMKASS